MRRRNFVFRLIKVRDVWWEFICGSRKVILGREMTCTNVWLEPRQRRVTTLSGVFVNGLSSRRSSPVRDESRHGNPGYCTMASVALAVSAILRLVCNVLQSIRSESRHCRKQIGADGLYFAIGRSLHLPIHAFFGCVVSVPDGFRCTNCVAGLLIAPQCFVVQLRQVISLLEANRSQ